MADVNVSLRPTGRYQVRWRADGRRFGRTVDTYDDALELAAHIRAGGDAPDLPPSYVIDMHGCWVWQLATTSGGYASGAGHRRFYEEHVGPIPAGMVLDHLCRNIACVNPAHMEVVTPAENLRRSARNRSAAEADAEARARLAEARP